MDLTRVEMLAEVVRRRDKLQSAKAKVGHEAEMLRQLADLEQTLLDQNVSRQAWEQHELLWCVYQAELRRVVVKMSAQALMTFDDIERCEPGSLKLDAQMLELLRWWREDGGREKYLSELPIEERRALERMEDEWRKKRE